MRCGAAGTEIWFRLGASEAINGLGRKSNPSLSSMHDRSLEATHHSAGRQGVKARASGGTLGGWVRNHGERGVGVSISAKLRSTAESHALEPTTNRHRRQ